MHFVHDVREERNDRSRLRRITKQTEPGRLIPGEINAAVDGHKPVKMQSGLKNQKELNQ